jgi:hypothetical protein
VSRNQFSFPVSSAQEMGNRETSTSTLIANRLRFPDEGDREPGPGNPKSGDFADRDSIHCEPDAISSDVKIHRRYEPAETAMDELVEVLYRLLVDAPDGCAKSSDSAASAPPEAPCFSIQPE